MILIPILALIIGLLLGTLIATDLPLAITPYIGVAVLASMDSVIGGIRSQLDGKFQTDIFVSGFFANILAAMFLVWLGDNIGIGLLQVSAVVFGIRIFTNLSLIRRFLITRFHDSKDRRKREAEQLALNTEESQS